MEGNYNKKESNRDNNGKINTHKHLWGINMNIILDHMIK